LCPLYLIFLNFARLCGRLVFLGRSAASKDAEVLVLPTRPDILAGHSRYRPALASQPGRPQMDLPAPDGTAAGQRRDHCAMFQQSLGQGKG
jgi:hypothetical protein